MQRNYVRERERERERILCMHVAIRLSMLRSDTNLIEAHMEKKKPHGDGLTFVEKVV
jgi:hypothetical protein